MAGFGLIGSSLKRELATEDRERILVRYLSHGSVGVSKAWTALDLVRSEPTNFLKSRTFELAFELDL